jgi:hypothetical protein
VVVKRAVERSLRALLCHAGSGCLCLCRVVVAGVVEGDNGEDVEVWGWAML